MTRFAKEISGQLGDYWKAEAQKELNRIQKEIQDTKYHKLYHVL